MKGKNRYRRAVSQFSKGKKDTEQIFSGLLGLIINGEQVVELPERDGFVWVRLRNAQNEVIQAFNPTTAQVYGLPVLVKWDEYSPTRYTIIGRDVGRYQDWGSASPYLAKHGTSHSFGIGNDVTWVYGQQFMPLNAVPSGTSGGPNVVVHPYTYFFNNEWHYSGGTGTSNLLTSKPSGASNAKLVLIYLDAATGNLGLIEGSEFDAGITGSSQVIPYIPLLGNPLTQIPVAAVRLVTGTARVGWDNIYDLKPYYATQASGTFGAGGGNGLSYVSGDDTTLGYLESKIVEGAGVTIQVLNPGGNEQLEISAGTGSFSFLALADTPGSYSGQALQGIRVNAGQTALEFTSFPIGPTGTVKVSGNDANDKFLEDALSAGTNITLVTINEGGNEKVRISSSGGAGGGTTFSGARRYLASGTSIPQNDWTSINFHWAVAGQNFDTDDYFHSGTSPNSAVNVPENNYYHLYGQIWMDAPPTGAYLQAAIWKNQSTMIAEKIDGYYDNHNPKTILIVSDDYLLTTDDVELRVFTNSPSGVSISTGTSRTFLGLHRISPPSTFSGARVYRESNDSIASGTPTAVTFETEEYDVTGYWDGGDPERFTVPGTPGDGYYHLSGQVGWEQNNEDDRLVYFRKNGTTQITTQIDEPLSNNTRHINAVSDVYLNSGDYVELVVVNNRPGNTNIRAGTGDATGAETFMCIHYLGS